MLHIISQINKSGYNFHCFFCRTIFIHTHALLRTICILYKLSTTILFYNNNCTLQCFQYFSSTVPHRFITLLCVIMHILLIITRADQKSIAIRLDSSSSSSVTFVSITRYTLWHIFNTLGLCVVTIQVLFGFCSIILRSTLRSVVTSSADVASSNRRIGALRRTARAIEIRCACPSERPRPRSPSALLIVSGSFPQSPMRMRFLKPR